jgi:hypothetical protein
MYKGKIMKNYLKLITLIAVINAVEVKSADIADRISSKFSKMGATQNVIIHNAANSYDFYVAANNEKRDNMHFVGRSKDDETIAIPIRIRKINNKRDEATLTIVLPLIDGNKYIERKRTFNIVAPAGNLSQLQQIDINYSKGTIFTHGKGFTIKFTPNDLGILTQQ